MIKRIAEMRQGKVWAIVYAFSFFGIVKGTITLTNKKVRLYFI